MREKNVIYDCHLEPRFGAMPLDEIRLGHKRIDETMLYLHGPRATLASA